MNAAQVIAEEIYASRCDLRPIVALRITTDAIPGSVVRVALTPERARNYALRAVPGGAVVAASEIVERCTEILLHPYDWYDILRNLPPLSVEWLLDRYVGLPVING